MIKIICKRTIEAVYFEEIFELYRKKVAPCSRQEPGAYQS